MVAKAKTDWLIAAKKSSYHLSVCFIMYYVYIIQSINEPEKVYVGYTADLKARIETHNAGRSIYTSRFKPWDLVMYLGFKNKLKAAAFEKYLKSRSGRLFLQKRFL